MSTDIRALLSPGYEPCDGSADGAQLIDGQWWHPMMGCDSLQIVIDNARAAVAQRADDTPSDPLSEQDLRQQWNAQADAFNQWESLDPSEQLDWAQSRAVAVDRNRRVALVQPGGQGPLPTNYIDPEHQGEDDLELLQTFYQACQSEGGAIPAKLEGFNA